MTLDHALDIWMTDNSSKAIDHEDAPLVDRAMKEWAEKRRDTWLCLRGPVGEEFSVLASAINSMQLTTAVSRTAATMRDKMGQDEKAENRRSAGFIESGS